MYQKPEVTRYSGSELLDLMGPVETAYCELRAPEEVECNSLESYLVDISDIPDFTRAVWVFTDPTRQQFEVRLDRGDCELSDSTWSCSFQWQCNDEPGFWEAAVELLNDETANCSDTFRLLDLN